MTQDLEGIDIYECRFFEVDSRGKLKFISRAFNDKTPDSFKSMTEIYDVTRFCMWIIRQPDTLDVSKHAALTFMVRLNEQKLKKIQKGFKAILRKKQQKAENNLTNDISKPGRKYV